MDDVVGFHGVRDYGARPGPEGVGSRNRAVERIATERRFRDYCEFTAARLAALAFWAYFEGR